MNIIETSIEDVVVLEGNRFEDNRGIFARLFCQQELASVVGDRHIVQINHSITHNAGAIRGLHFQYPPHAEMKLVRCLKGGVWDVAVDLRKNSPTFLQWHGVELSPENRLMLVIPEGCAHGFQTLEADSELLYLHTAFYSPESEGGVRFDDPSIGIKWLRDVADLSQRDKNHPLLEPDFPGVTL